MPPNGSAGGDAPALMPLAVGAVWTYDLRYVEAGVPVEATMMLAVDGTETVDGRAFFHLSTELRQDTAVVDPGTDLYLRAATTGVEWLTYDGGERTDSLFFRYPVTDEASFPLGVVGEESVTAYVETGRITVPAGTFDAVRYQFIAAGDEIEYAFAPGIGLLRVTYEAIDPDFDSLFELRRYDQP